MAQIKIEEVIDYLDSDIRRALQEAVLRVIPNAEFDRNQLFREFVRAVGRKCRTWESVPDHYVEKK
jgi:hypothetical protein